MKRGILAFTVLAAISFATPAVAARRLPRLDPRVESVSRHSPQRASASACENCGHEVCVNRDKVEDCVVGEKKCYRSVIRKEYVAIPETHTSGK